LADALVLGIEKEIERELVEDIARIMQRWLADVV